MKNAYRSETETIRQQEEEDQAAQGEETSRDGTGTVLFRRGDRQFCAMTVIGQIEGHYLLPSNTKTTKYEHMLPRLIAAAEDPQINGLLLVLNTVGGDIEAGLAMAELVAGMNKPSVSLVLGGGHSIGVPLAVAADRSFIAPTAGMTVHPVRMTGLVAGAPQTFEYFRSIQERIVRFVCGHSGMEAARFRELMFNSGSLMNDLGTLLTGEEAVAAGLVDAVGTLSDAASALEALADQNNS